MLKKLFVPVVAVVLAISSTACAAPTTTPGEATASATSAPMATTPIASTTSEPAAPSGSDTAGPTPAVSTPEAPADPPAAAAWEALMSPDGEYASSAAYQAVIDTFGPVEPYVSIQAAEERHIDALTRRLERFGVEAPPNPYVGTIPAPEDLEAAATAWATEEVDNIALYDRLLAQAEADPALTRVFTNLRRASQEEHLPAFEAAAANGGQLTREQMAELGLH